MGDPIPDSTSSSISNPVGATFIELGSSGSGNASVRRRRGGRVELVVTPVGELGVHCSSVGVLGELGFVLGSSDFGEADLCMVSACRRGLSWVLLSDPSGSRP